MRARIGCVPLLCGLLAVPALATAARGQDSVTVAPNPAYQASGFEQIFLGKYYRRLWNTPIRVPVLNLDTTAGGLVPTERGGGRQTHSLHFRGANDREYVFRSVDKFAGLSEEPALAGTAVGWLVQDQTSALDPAGALAIPVLLDAVGIAHPIPRLAVMPDDPALGEFRAEYAGMLGEFEERPDEIEEADGERPGFGGFENIVGTDRLIERLNEDHKERVDARAYLTARLVDLLIGDWDRHEDQWRWANDERADTTYWIPIPRDRDYAFVDYDGLMMRLGRIFVPNAVRFTPEISNIYGLTLNARILDRRFLSSLDRAVWDSVTAFVQSRITDDVIRRAVDDMPAAFGPANERIAGLLESRRASLPDAAAKLYALLSSEVDVDATDDRDIAIVDRRDDGSVRVRIFDADKENRRHGPPYFDRRFVPGETNDVRIYLHGGDDQALVRGNAERSVRVRVIGGDGDDLMVDSSRVERGGAPTVFYDAQGDNRFVSGAGTRVDTKPFDEPERQMTLAGETGRDWGHRVSVWPIVDYHGPDGLILGGGWTYTHYGFRKLPYDYNISLSGKIGTLSGGVEVQAAGDFHRANSRSGYAALLNASQLESIRFHGFGNETAAALPSDYYTVRQDRVVAGVAYRRGVGRAGTLSLGPLAKYTRSQIPAGTPFQEANRFGENFFQAGAAGDVMLDARDSRSFPSRGFVASAGGSIFPGALSTSETFGEAHAVGSTYWTPGLPARPTIALRAGAKKVWGDFPVHEAAFLGGSRTVRGYSYQRFAGDGVVFGNAALRVPIGVVKSLVRGELNALGFVDAGRVFLAGESSSEWHAATGAGISFDFRVRSTPIGASVVYARGDEGKVYVKLGAPF